MSSLLIAGGGAAAMSLALAMQKFSPRLLDTGGGGSGGGRYYALGRRSVDFLRGVGVCPSLLAVRRFELRAGAVHLPLSGTADKPLCHIVAEENLLDMLRQRLRATRIPITTCEKIIWRKTTKTAVCLTADDEEISADLLAVADGARSPMALQMGVFGAAVDFRQQAIVAIVSTSSLPPDTAAQWFEDNDVAALLPIGEGKFCLIWSTASPPPLAEIEDSLSRRLNLPEIKVIGEASVFPLYGFRRAVRVAPRTAFLGDAAGVIHPLAGQGLNLGIDDVKCLSACVRPHDAGAKEGLAAYAATAGGRFSLLSAVTSGFARSGNLAKFALLAGKFPGARRAASCFANG